MDRPCKPTYLLIIPADFHFYNAAETILNIVNRSAARPLVGEPLCCNETWLRTSLDTTINTGKICLDLQKYPALLRPLVYPFTEGRKKLNDSFETARKLLSGVIKSRGRHSKNVDILQWLIDCYKGDKMDISFLTNQTLFVATASTRSTATSIVNTLFDLIEFSQYQQPLRREIDEAVRECGGWNLAAIQKMKKLDSFIKESQRLNHHLLRKRLSSLNLPRDIVISLEDASSRANQFSLIQPQSPSKNHAFRRSHYPIRHFHLDASLLDSP